MDVTVYTRSTAGAKFTLTDATGKMAPFVSNFEIKHTGTDDVSENPTHLSVTPDEKIVGPQQIKVKADSNGGRWSTHNFLVVFTVYTMN